jgi:trigger factor
MVRKKNPKKNLRLKKPNQKKRKKRKKQKRRTKNNMEIKTNQLTGSEVELEVELTSKELKTYVEQAEKNLGADLEVKGFRKGKVPSDVVRKTISEEKIREEALSLAVEDSFAKAVEEKGLELLEPAKGVDIKENTKEKLVYVAKVTVLPKFELSAYKEVEVKKNEIVVEDKEVSDAIDYVRKTRSTYSESKEPAQKGNRAEIDFEIKIEGKVIDNGVSKNHPLILGNETFVPGFEDNIMGMKAGEEKTFDLNVPADYYQKSIAGKIIQCSVKVHKVEIISLPKLTDEFAKSLGAFENVAELKKSIGDGVRMEKEQKEKQRIRGAILDKIAENTTLEIPQVLVERQLENLIREFDASLHQQGMELNLYLTSVKKTQDDLKNEWKPQAEKQVKNSLILREVAKTEKLSVEEGELNESLAMFLQKFPNPESLKDLNQDVLKRNIYEDLLKEKTLQFLEDNAKLL